MRNIFLNLNLAKFKVIKSIFAGIIFFTTSISFFTSSIADDSEENPRAVELNNLWTSSLGTEQPQETWYGDVLKFKPKVADSASSVGSATATKCNGAGSLPTRGCIATKKSGTDNQTIVMDVMSIQASTAAVKERLAEAEIFLNQVEAVQLAGLSENSSRVIMRRQRSAQIEVFLGSLLRFAEADTLAARCATITRAEGVFGANPIDIKTSDIEAGWQAALEIYVQVKNTFGSLKALKEDICLSRTVSTRQQIENEAKNEALKQIARALKKTEDDTRVEMTRVLEGYQAQRDKVKALNYYAPELLELNQQVGNIVANVQLVQQDGLCASSITNCAGAQKSLLDSVKEIDLSKLEGGLKVDERPEHPLFVSNKTLKDYIEAETTGLKVLLRSLETIATTVPEPLRSKVAVCKGLEVSFNTTTYTGSSTNDPFLLKFKACVQAALDTINDNQAARTGDKKLEQEFSKNMTVLVKAALAQ